MLYEVITFSSCNEQSIDQEAEAEKLMGLSREWARSAQTDDLEKTLNFWAEDAIQYLKPFAGKIQDLSISSDLYHYDENVITSYSIHYTKLYEASVLRFPCL